MQAPPTPSCIGPMQPEPLTSLTPAQRPKSHSCAAMLATKCQSMSSLLDKLTSVFSVTVVGVVFFVGMSSFALVVTGPTSTGPSSVEHVPAPTSTLMTARTTTNAATTPANATPPMTATVALPRSLRRRLMIG